MIIALGNLIRFLMRERTTTCFDFVSGCTPADGDVYPAGMRGKGNNAVVTILRVGRTGQIAELSLKDVASASVQLPSPAEKAPALSIARLVYAKERLFVAGLSNEEFAST